MSDLSHQGLQISLGYLLVGLFSNLPGILHKLDVTGIIKDHKGDVCVEVTELLPLDDLSLDIGALDGSAPFIELFVSECLLGLSDSAALCLWLSGDLCEGILHDVKSAVLEWESHHVHESGVVNKSVLRLVPARLVVELHQCLDLNNRWENAKEVSKIITTYLYLRRPSSKPS